MSKSELPFRTFRARFFCGDAVVMEVELYNWEAEYFRTTDQEPFNESLERRRLAKQLDCPFSMVSVRVSLVP